MFRLYRTRWYSAGPRSNTTDSDDGASATELFTLVAPSSKGGDSLTSKRKGATAVGQSLSGHLHQPTTRYCQLFISTILEWENNKPSTPRNISVQFSICTDVRSMHIGFPRNGIKSKLLWVCICVCVCGEGGDEKRRRTKRYKLQMRVVMASAER